MDSYHRGFFYRFRTPLRVLGILLLFAVVLGGVYVMTLTKPGPAVQYRRGEKSPKAAETSTLEARSQALADEFSRNVLLRPALQEDFALLDESIRIEQQILALNDGHNTGAFSRLEKLRKLRDEHAARSLADDSRQAQQAAVKETDRDVRLEKTRLALQLQERINRDYPQSSAASLLQATRLRREVDHLEAEPIYNESIAAEQASAQAQEQLQWTEAVAGLQRAIELQTILNEQYRGLRFSSPHRLSRLNEQLDSLRASDLREQMQALEKQIEEATARNEHQQVTAYLEQLLRVQEAINRTFPNSRFASDVALKTLALRRDEARSMGIAQQIIRQSSTVDELLRARNVGKAVELINMLAPQIDSFTTAFPDSRLLGAELLLKFRFLDAVKGSLAQIQDTLHSQLLPLPEKQALRMLRTEVPQELYQQVMTNANPSRHRGPRLPVDSVNHGEAVEFSRRLGWALGLPVRLPTEAEFREALGRDRYARLADLTWNFENAQGVTHEVGTREPNGNGFYDLLGNVSEWLLSDDLRSGSEARQAGGNIENTVDQLADVPVQITNALGRNRHNGFRIVVDSAPEPAAAAQ